METQRKKKKTNMTNESEKLLELFLHILCVSRWQKTKQKPKNKNVFLFFTLHVSLKGQHKTLTHTHKHTTEEPLRSRCISYQKIRNCLQLCNYALGPNDGEI